MQVALMIPCYMDLFYWSRHAYLAMRTTSTATTISLAACGRLLPRCLYITTVTDKAEKPLSPYGGDIH